MEMELEKGGIRMSKVLSAYDDLALSFSAKLRKAGAKHVFVSGYVALLFGRSRISEEIDILVGRMPYGTFQKLWRTLAISTATTQMTQRPHTMNT